MSEDRLQAIKDATTIKSFGDADRNWLISEVDQLRRVVRRLEEVVSHHDAVRARAARLRLARCAEAEALRRGVEQVLAGLPEDDPDSEIRIKARLRELLDTVDAADSVRWLEHVERSSAGRA